MFTENNCTDILAMPDGGAISTLKGRINRIVEKVLSTSTLMIGSEQQQHQRGYEDAHLFLHWVRLAHGIKAIIGHSP